MARLNKGLYPGWLDLLLDFLPSQKMCGFWCFIFQKASVNLATLKN